MRFAAAAITAALATLRLAAAMPMPQADGSKPAFGVSFTFENGTFTEVIEVEDDLGLKPVASFLGDAPVALVFFEPAVTGQFGVCTILAPDRQGLGRFSFNKASIRELETPAAVGFVQCNSE